MLKLKESIQRWSVLVKWKASIFKTYQTILETRKYGTINNEKNKLFIRWFYFHRVSFKKWYITKKCYKLDELFLFISL
ncbi:MAG: hypothetical protein L0M06_07425, partial [Enterococcus sp.]|uniref:hypothetical protein n=1 Tax=Enterococcus sp. TaxID=35783 RepID=UPI0026490874